MEYAATSGRYDEVHALCCRFKGEKVCEKIKGIYVHRFNPSIWFKVQNYVANNKKIKRICEVLQKIVMIPFFPKLYPITTRRFYKATLLLQKSNKFDIVVSAHGGLLTLLTGCRLKKTIVTLNHIALLWDPVKGQIATAFLPKSFTDKRIDNIERFVADNTSLQISTASMREYHLENGDIAANHRVYLDIPGILEPTYEVPTNHLKLLREGYINIIFSGLLSANQRDPRPIIQLLNNCIYAERINLIFFSMGANEVLNDAKKKFKGSITIHDYIPLAELHTMYIYADYLLNISHVNSNMVPSKIFEYMSYGKPIISTFTTKGDAAQTYISRYSEGLCIDLNNPEETNINLLDTFFSSEHKIIPFDIVKEQFIENTPESYIQVFDDFLMQK